VAGCLVGICIAIAVSRVRRQRQRAVCPSHGAPTGPLVLWCEYGADPTWRFVDGGPRVASVDMDSLGLTEATKNALRAWSRHFEDITWPPDTDDPIGPPDFVWHPFVTEGERLRERVAAELGPDADVVLDHRR
jgi:hypothetical protein